MFGLTLRARGLECGVAVVACKRRRNTQTSSVSLLPSAEAAEEPEPFGFPSLLCRQRTQGAGFL